MKIRISLSFLLLLSAAGCGGDSADALKRAVELCNNGRDDTGNGLADCADPACQSNAACGAGVGTCGDNVRSQTEVCDGIDLAGATCESQGFTGGILACAANCGAYDTFGCSGTGGLPNCGNDALDPGETCDGISMGGATCDSLGGFVGGTLTCRRDCTGYDTSRCTPATGGCGNNALDAGEVCDGSALNGQDCVSRGYELGGTLACELICQRYDESGCQSGATCQNGVREGPEECDGGDLGGASCQTLGQGFSSGNLGCNASCTFDTSQCQTAQTCGNNSAEGTELCDGTDVGTASCASEGFSSGTLLCNSTCTGFDTSACETASSCNNGVLDAGEVCDLSNLGGQTCATQGYKTGTLGCAPGCGAFDTTQCSGYPNCGNGVADGLDACDGQAWDAGPSPACANFNLGVGNVTCTSDCGLDFSSCTNSDYCAAQGWYGDGTICDPCEAWGGTPDPDCETVCQARDG
ncbi:MAG: hypothetical protein AAFQ82_19315, partial [Myxococcota bacterium]